MATNPSFFIPGASLGASLHEDVAYEMSLQSTPLHGESSPVPEGGASILLRAVLETRSNSPSCYLIPQSGSDGRFFILLTSIWHFPSLRQEHT